MECSVGTSSEVSTRDNLNQGHRPFCKDCAVEVECDEDEANDVEIITSIVEIKNSVFNAYVKYSW